MLIVDLVNTVFLQYKSWEFDLYHNAISLMSILLSESSPTMGDKPQLQPTWSR